MSERIYYDDAYAREFEATVIRVESRNGAQAVVLDRSAFYPTSGGQPFDTGTLGAWTVTAVEDQSGEVVHALDGADPVAAGQQLRGTIDWARRFDHMQQHTGQHVLSAAFVRAAGVPTVSFHMGADLCTIDLATEVSADQVAAAEQLANQVVWESRPVLVSYADAADGEALGLRKPSRRSGTLRLVEVEGFDRSACGGTHVRTTSEIGLIAVTALERFRGGTRLEFACGARALRQFHRLRDTVTATVRLLSVLPVDIPAAVGRLQAESRDQKRSLSAAAEELSAFRAERLLTMAEPFGQGRGIFAIVDGDASALRALASALTRQPGLLVILVSSVQPSVAVVARSRDLDAGCDAIIRLGLDRFGGRGGGKPDMAQAGGLAGSPDDILLHLRHSAH